jgi:hypothetical protein
MAMNRMKRWVAGAALIGLAGFAGTAAAGVDVHIGLGVPLGGYYDYYPSTTYVHEYYAPRPVYHYYNDYGSRHRHYSTHRHYDRHHHHHHRHHYHDRHGHWDRRGHGQGHRGHWRGDDRRWNDGDRHRHRDHGHRRGDGRNWQERFHDRHRDRR